MTVFGLARKLRPALGLLVILALALAACGGPSTGTPGDLQLSLRVDPPASQVGDVTLIITVTDQDGQPVDDATLQVEGNMIHPGMVPVTAQAEGGQDGIYRVPFTWTMGGDWVITVGASVPDGRQAQVDFPLSVEGN